ncbi:Protein GET1 [Ceratobasidium theobromae]|uniref:Protein GET1 n=1 Tax=Ceratobasidium theobromae TaxID=1582974 RepID=A0A5N5QKW1_9AGAM|nr:Protein GET1 [Ceratobasidium theobromae]
MSILITIFILVFLTELVRWIGKSVLLELLYPVYTRVFLKPTVDRQRTLRADVLAAKRDLLQTSSQDQFAKWAKLRRRVDRGLAELDTINSTLATARTSFSVKFSTGLWVCTTGAQFFIGWWYGRSAVFYLPPGWMGPATWWLSLPFAPRGSVSCGVWQMACQRVLRMLERLVRDAFLKHDPPSIMVEEEPDSPGSASSANTFSSPKATKPVSPFEETTNNTSSDEKAGLSARERDRAELRARLAARQSARAAR